MSARRYRPCPPSVTIANARRTRFRGYSFTTPATSTSKHAVERRYSHPAHWRGPFGQGVGTSETQDQGALHGPAVDPHEDAEVNEEGS